MLPVPPIRLPRALVVALLVVLAVLAPATAASAHAELASTSPGDGSIVDTAPDEITMQFTEDVSLRPDGVRVLGGDGERVDLGDASSSGADVTVPLEDDLTRGTYVVAWRVVSADGHPVRGAFSFSVGEETAVGSDLANQAFGGGSDRAYEWADALFRGLAYLTVLGAAGFVLLASTLRRDDDPSPVGRPTTVASTIGLVSILLQVPLQGALATGRGLGAITEPEVLGLAVADGMGLAALVTGAGLLAIIITAGLPWEGAARRVALIGAAVAPVGFALTGHTRTMSPLLVGYLADVVHVLAATVWFGGLIALVTIIRRRRRDDDPFAAAEAVARFSGWAGTILAVLVAAGLVLGWIEVGSLDALTTTLYGRLLLVKTGLVLVVVAAAAWNRFRLVPRVAAAAVEEPPRDDGAAWRSLVRSVKAEVVLIAVVLAVTAVLVNVAPAKVAVDPGPVTVTAPLGDGTVEVTVDPAKVGRNDIHLYVFDAQGRADDQYEDAALALSLPSKGIGPLDREPVAVGNGHFQLVATELPLAGEWELEVTVKPDRFTEQTATVTFPVE